MDGPRAIPREVISATIRQTYNIERAVDSVGRRAALPQSADPRHISRRCRWSSARRRSRASRARSGRTSTDGTAGSGTSAPMPAGTKSGSDFSRAGATCGSTRTLLGDNIARQSQYFNSATHLRFQQNKYGMTHTLNWDIRIAVPAAASDCRVLQRPVLRIFRRIPVHRSQPRQHDYRPEGFTLPLLGHARRHRERLEHLRRPRRYR